MLFLSTPSARRATLLRAECYPHCHISIHALREEGDLEALRVILGVEISIHALREEGDLVILGSTATTNISIHALREEGDLAVKVKGYFRFPFLSTPSARRATPAGTQAWWQYAISIHALREEGDMVAHRLALAP